MKQDPEFFEGKEPTLIYIAKRLKDALKLEQILADEAVIVPLFHDRTYRFARPEVEGLTMTSLLSIVLSTVARATSPCL